jgi:3'-phosphoadenosine 5'-phosphosulfate (PAPS) 3'-phosphatase
MPQVTRLGLDQAAQSLIPIMIQAGKGACCIQASLQNGVDGVMSAKESEDHHWSKQAVTDADIAVGNAIGLAALQLSDITLLSEEQHGDAISRYFKANQPFALFLDPINGTAYFKDGKKCFEVLFTLCDRETHQKQRLTVLFLPRMGLIYKGNDHKTLRASVDDEQVINLDWEEHHIPLQGKKTIYVSRSLRHRLKDIQEIEPDSIVAHDAYDEYGRMDPDWDAVPSGLLDGRLGAVVVKDVADMEDTLAILYLAKGAGAELFVKGYDVKTHRAQMVIAATDKKIFDALCACLQNE